MGIFAKHIPSYIEYTREAFLHVKHMQAFSNFLELVSPKAGVGRSNRPWGATKIEGHSTFTTSALCVCGYVQNFGEEGLFLLFLRRLYTLQKVHSALFADVKTDSRLKSQPRTEKSDLKLG